MLCGIEPGMLVVLLIAGVVLDLLLGETRRWHPLVGFGRLADFLERRLNRRSRLLGGLAWLLAVLPLVLLGGWLAHWWIGLHAVLLYFCLGLRSLRDHTLPIQRALENNDLASARALTGRIVSRDTSAADPRALATACVESLLENGNDAVFGTLFWFVVAGAPGALLFRLANTLDAMWGYRTARLEAYGCVAARIDDALNFLPARLTALSYALLGQRRNALYCWRSQAAAWSSPNAGPVMSSGAGALGLCLGGPAIYHGVLEQRPPLGRGRAAAAADIGRAWRLVLGTTFLWLTLLALVAGLLILKG